MTYFPMAFPRQPCVVCLEPCEVSESVAEVDVEGKLCGWRHAECSRDDG